MTPSKELTFDTRQMAALYRLGKLARARLDLGGDDLVIHAARGALASAVAERAQRV